MRRLPSFFALRAFEAAARLGGFTHAAAELHVTPSAISHQVRALETWFDKPLFIRSVRRISLTEEGRRLLESLTPAFDIIEDACADLRPANQRSGLSVHCAPSFAAKWLSPRLPDFMKKHPGITIRLSSSAEPADLQQELDLDIDIAYNAPDHAAGIHVEPLGMETTVPMCSPRLLSNDASLKPEHLLKFTLIDSQLNPVKWTDWCKLNNVKLPNRDRPSFDRGSLAVAAAASAMGIALETTRFAEAELACGELIVLDAPGLRPIVRETHFLCYRKAERRNPELLSFKRWLGEQLSIDLG